MNTADMAMNFANVVNLIAVLLLMRVIIKNRNILKGYSVSGTFLTFIAILGFEIGFYLMENYISFGLGIINLAFWFLAFVFSLRNFMREQRISQNLIPSNNRANNQLIKNLRVRYIRKFRTNPEFPSWIILPLFLITSSIVVIVKWERKKVSQSI